jgi:uncharacterized repeat protein (TIGR01451 family)
MSKWGHAGSTRRVRDEREQSPGNSRSRRRSLIVKTASLAAISTLLVSAPALAATGSLPGGTSLSVTIDSPIENATVPAGTLNVTGTASVGAGAAVKNQTIAYVVDVSGSTADNSGVDCTGDSVSDTTLTCEQAGVKSVNTQAALANSPVLNSGVAEFSDSGTALDVDPAAGTQLLTAPGSNIANAVDTLSSGGGTNFNAGITAANSILTAPGAASVQTIVFLSDGLNTVAGTTPNLSGQTVLTFAVGSGSSCGGTVHPTLGDLAAAGGPGSSCTQVTDLSQLGNIISAGVGSTLDSLQIAIDGGTPTTIPNTDITPTLPQNGAASVSYSTNSMNITVTPGGHQICVTANGTDAGGSGSESTCTDITVPSLVTSVSSSPATPPDFVTAGNDVLYTLSVQNQAATTATGVHVLATLDANVTPVSSSPSGSCTITTPVSNCTIGSIAAGATASVTLLAKAPSPAPGSGKITLSATATPGTNNTATVDTAVHAPVPGQTSGYVPPGNSIDTGGNNPTNLSLPNTGNGAPVTIIQTTGGQFCNGPCSFPVSAINDFNGYKDPTHPIRLILKIAEPNLVTATKDFLNATIYHQFDNEPANVGHVVPDCLDNPAWTTAQKVAAALRRLARLGTQSGIANPSPCVDSRTITPLTKNLVTGPYQVTFTILYLSQDGKYTGH